MAARSQKHSGTHNFSYLNGGHLLHPSALSSCAAPHYLPYASSQYDLRVHAYTYIISSACVQDTCIQLCQCMLRAIHCTSIEDTCIWYNVTRCAELVVQQYQRRCSIVWAYKCANEYNRGAQHTRSQVLRDSIFYIRSVRCSAANVPVQQSPTVCQCSVHWSQS
jgi:hypothetical protein